MQHRRNPRPKPTRPSSPLGAGVPALRRSSGLGQLVTNENGAATAEYAIATLAAVGFAGLLVVIMRSDEVRQMLTDVVRTALTLPG